MNKETETTNNQDLSTQIDAEMKIAGLKQAGGSEIVDDTFIRLHFFTSNDATDFFDCVVKAGPDLADSISQNWSFDTRLLAMINEQNNQLKFHLVILLKFPVCDMALVLNALRKNNQGGEPMEDEN